jgi:PKD repeat protein
MIHSIRKLSKKTFFIGLLAMQQSLNGFSQEWAKLMDKPDANFYDIKKEFNDWKIKYPDAKKGWKPYKRWEWFMEPRLYPHGDISRPNTHLQEFRDNKSKYKQQANSGNWSMIGPSTVPGSDGGAGRLNFITFHPTDANTYYVGAPAGGLWGTNDAGSTWTVLTDDLEVIGASDLLIDPGNPNVMYLATGDGDGGHTYSVGILKSTDGGATWSSTGFSKSVSHGWKIYKMVMNPNNTDVILVATNGGLYRTTDGGSTFSSIITSTLNDVEFQPGNPDVVYAAGLEFYKSTNGGASFSQVTSGLPSSSSVYRLSIAVTDDDANYVYLLAGGASSVEYGLYGFYRSTNGGSSFSTMATSPNLLGWESDGSDSGGQSWYDLSLTVSPTNKNEVFVGGVNVWQSTDGGSNWSISSHWYGQNGNPYAHADVHRLEYYDSNTIFSCNDGGLFKSSNNGTSWTDLSDGLVIAQMYKIGLSATNANLIITGNQDNGTNVYNSGSWDRPLGGDGMECLIDYSDENYMYGELYYGQIYKSSNKGASFSTLISGSITEEGDWVTPFVIDPSDPQTLYAAYDNIWRTDNRGSSWTKLSGFSHSEKLKSLAVSPSNSSYIYTATKNQLYVSSDRGISWSDISSGLPTSSAAITYIAINPTAPLKLWVTFSGYSSGNKVFYSSDGGNNWQNISGTLPNLPVNCIVYENGSNDGLYVGTDVGVYYIDNTLNDWTSFMTGMPNVVIDELEIDYLSDLIYAGTFGRGLWKSDLYSSSSQSGVPNANFAASATSICIGSSVQFTDQSSSSPTSWSWSFPGGTPSSSTSQNPSVTYSSAGTFDVTLIASNANGTDTIAMSSYISIDGGEPMPYAEEFNAVNFPPQNWSVSNSDNFITWDHISVIDANNASSKVAYMNFYSYAYVGEIDDLISESIDLSSVSSPVLTFYVAYDTYDGTYADQLSVYVSTDCGDTYDVNPVYQKSGSALETVSPTGYELLPTSPADWRQESVDLSAYIGSSVSLKFESICDYGNNLFVDDINIDGQTLTLFNESGKNKIEVYPNPANQVLNISLSAKDSYQVELIDAKGQLVYKSSISASTQKHGIDLKSFSNGVYMLKLSSDQQTLNQRVVISR